VQKRRAGRHFENPDAPAAFHGVALAGDILGRHAVARLVSALTQAPGARHL